MLTSGIATVWELVAARPVLLLVKGTKFYAYYQSKRRSKSIAKCASRLIIGQANDED